MKKDTVRHRKRMLEEIFEWPETLERTFRAGREQARAFAQRRGFRWLVQVAAGGLLLGAGLTLPVSAQRWEDFTTPVPVEPGDTLIIGFMGGRDRWDNDTRAVRKLALALRRENLAGVHVETVENRKRSLALNLVRRAFDHNNDGRLDQEERAAARVILYGHSFGGAAVVKFARQLEELDVAVRLTVQVDSVGRGDAEIPPNVARAANLYQSDGWFIRGEPEIRAADPARTEILGNFRYDYSGRDIDLSDEPWHKKLFRRAHAKMEHDPEVWAKVKELILAELARLPDGGGQSADQERKRR